MVTEGSRSLAGRLSVARSLDREPFPVPAVTRVVLKNYKSIAACDVQLGRVTLLVGPNGAGKSNFLDALRLISDALRSTLEYALRERGGISEVRRRSRGHPTHFGVRVELALAEGWTASYAFEVAARRGGVFEVQREECNVYKDGDRVAWLSVRSGVLVDADNPDIYPIENSSDRLYLQVVSGTPYFRRVFRLLASMGFYNLNPDSMRDLQNPDVGDLLLRDGRNLAAVVRQLNARAPEVAARISAYLNTVVPGVKGVSARSLGPMETIEVRQDVSGDENPWRYLAPSLSDGTLRAIGVLVAAFQSIGGHLVPLVAIEEPESAIHPGAAVRLMDALLEASSQSQLLLTTHSPDLLEHPDVQADFILAVESQQGTSVIGRVDARTKTALKENLYTVGELLRLEQVAPDLFAVEADVRQLRLFDRVGDLGA